MAAATPTGIAPAEKQMRYELLREMGRGSMGILYVARDTLLDRRVALKTLRSHEPELIYRLKNEFRSLARLSHANLVQLYDLVIDGGRSFITMELISGVDFVRFVRGDGAAGSGTALTEEAFERLRAALAGLAAGLHALHAHGKLHRDIKPANVLVEPGGRVVLLDFGLVSELRAGRNVNPDDELSGTLAYLAPEVARGGSVTSAADWYSVGVMLYETLTGRLPYEGAHLVGLLRGSSPRPVTPLRNLVSSVPGDLDTLVTQLLATDPQTRIAAAEAIIPREAARSIESPVPPSPIPLFVGRTAERAHLHEALAETEKHCVTVCVRGVSGIGKTALVERFLAEIDQEDVVVLRGRCHPHESVPFKAVDGLVDDLARALLRREPESLASVLPAEVAALTTVFPVLRRVPALAAAADAHQVPAEPRETRQAAFAALRELLSRMALQSPLVLWIDDLQWGDLDSSDLLRELYFPPGPPRCLVLFSFRSEDELTSPILRVLVGDDVAAAFSPKFLDIGALDLEESTELARSLVRSRGGNPGDLRLIANEAGGSPFFTCELARNWNCDDDQPIVARDSQLDRLTGVLARRIERLPPAARCLLNVVSLAGQPLPEEVAFRSVTGGDVLHALSFLRNECFLRSVPLPAGAGIASYHERIRETVVGLLPAALRRELHHQLAEALASSDSADPETLMLHYLGADEPQQASGHAIAAAERAAAALAFNRAAELYRRALSLGTGGRPSWLLHAQLGDALVNAGRSAEGAASLLTAAETLAREAPGDLELVRLKRRAAEHFLRSGLHDEGVQVTRDALRAAGLPYASTTARSVLALLGNRLLLRLRRRMRPAISRGTVSDVQRERLEVCWSAGLGLSYFDSLRAAEYQVRHALLALRSGDPAHLARALTTEALLLAWERGPRAQAESDSLLAEGERLAHTTGDPNVIAHSQVMHAAKAYADRRLPEALAICAEGEAWCRNRCVGAAWELANFQNVRGCTLVLLGDLDRVWQHLPQDMHAAEERGDEYALLTFRLGLINLAWLAIDRPDEAERHDALAAQRCGSGGFFGYLHALARAQIDLYRGDGKAGWRHLGEAWPALRSSQILRFHLPRADLREARARCALACMTAEAGHGERRRMQHAVLQECRQLEREGAEWTAALALALRSGIAAREGRWAEAVEGSLEAAKVFDRFGLHLRAAAARYFAATVRGGGNGARERLEQTEWMRNRGIINPERMAAMMMPALSGGPTS